MLIWALLSDRVKLLAYQFIDPVKNERKPEMKAPSDLTQLDLHRGRQNGHAKEDWEKSVQPGNAINDEMEKSNDQ